MLFEVVQSGTGRGATLRGREVAGKTGTSADHRDAWFVGYSPELVAGVWVGNDDFTPMKRVTGGAIPAQIWRGFMQTALKGVRAKPLPKAEPIYAPLIAEFDDDETRARLFPRLGRLLDRVLGDSRRLRVPETLPRQAPLPDVRLSEREYAQDAGPVPRASDVPPDVRRPEPYDERGYMRDRYAYRPAPRRDELRPYARRPEPRFEPEYARERYPYAPNVEPDPRSRYGYGYEPRSRPRYDNGPDPYYTAPRRAPPPAYYDPRYRDYR